MNDARLYPPPSPCVSICTLDENRVCNGCRRTLAEIAAWSSLSATDQWAIVDELSTRGPNFKPQA